METSTGIASNERRTLLEENSRDIVINLMEHLKK